MRKILIIIIFPFLISGMCGKEKLKLSVIEYNDNSIRVDGLYFNSVEKNLYIFNRNGILQTFHYSENSIDEVINYIKTSNEFKNIYKLPYYWGVFVVKNNKIEIEEWHSSDAFGRYTLSHTIGEILNDTTIVFNKQDTFMFYHFEPKPDSIPNFNIK